MVKDYCCNNLGAVSNTSAAPYYLAGGIVAKRLTDSRKYFDPWFRKLGAEYKLFWYYMLDMCNHAGIFLFDLDHTNYLLKTSLSEKGIKEAFGDKIFYVSGEKWFIPKFVEFQYGELDEKNRVHKSVLTILKKEGAYKALTRPLLGCKDKVKVKVKVKKEENKELMQRIYNAYQHYPRKEGKQKGINVLSSQIKTETDLQNFERAVKNYAEANRDTDRKFIKLFNSFCNKDVWPEWIEWEDPEYKLRKW